MDQVTPKIHVQFKEGKRTRINLGPNGAVLFVEVQSQPDGSMNILPTVFPPEKARSEDQYKAQYIAAIAATALVNPEIFAAAESVYLKNVERLKAQQDAAAKEAAKAAEKQDPEAARKARLGGVQVDK